MQPGALTIEPIHSLLFDRKGGQYLNLDEEQLDIHYKTYECNSKEDMQQVHEQKLTPGQFLMY